MGVSVSETEDTDATCTLASSVTQWKQIYREQLVLRTWYQHSAFKVGIHFGLALFWSHALAVH